MVIASELPLPLPATAVAFQLPKLGSGMMPVVENAGRSWIHSMLSLVQVVQGLVLVKPALEWVASFTVSLYEVPVRVTDALILSPGFRDLPTSTDPAGNISNQVK